MSFSERLKLKVERQSPPRTAATAEFSRRAEQRHARPERGAEPWAPARSRAQLQVVTLGHGRQQWAVSPATVTQHASPATLATMPLGIQFGKAKTKEKPKEEAKVQRTPTVEDKYDMKDVLGT